MVQNCAMTVIIIDQNYRNRILFLGYHSEFNFLIVLLFVLNKNYEKKSCASVNALNLYRNIAI